jgi:hypothetical protein
MGWGKVGMFADCSWRPLDCRLAPLRLTAGAALAAFRVIGNFFYR